jgi:hypothetical protein
VFSWICQMVTTLGRAPRMTRPRPSAGQSRRTLTCPSRRASAPRPPAPATFPHGHPAAYAMQTDPSSLVHQNFGPSQSNPQNMGMSVSHMSHYDKGFGSNSDVSLYNPSCTVPHFPPNGGPVIHDPTLPSGNPFDPEVYSHQIGYDNPNGHPFGPEPLSHNMNHGNLSGGPHFATPYPVESSPSVSAFHPSISGHHPQTSR